MCRRSGLEIKRKCGYLQRTWHENGAPVWGRREVLLHTCPKSFVAADSLALLEEFFVRRRMGGWHVESLSARQVDAFMLLEKEMQEEIKHGQRARTPTV